MDIIDNDPTYWHDRGKEWHDMWHNYYVEQLKNILPDIILPPGIIIEYGSHDGRTIDFLLDQYQDRSIIGIEYNHPGNHKNVIEMDVRDLTGDMDIALAINDLSDYDIAPESKTYAKNHAIKNVVMDGFYIEFTKHELKPINGFHIVYESKWVTAYRKFKSINTIV